MSVVEKIEIVFSTTVTDTMDPPVEQKKSLSFGFVKKQETVQLKKSAVVENEEEADRTKDFVLSLEGKELKSTKSDRREKKKPEYVIPLINQNRWRAEHDNVESNNLDILAAEEIMKDSAKLNDDWEQKGSCEDSTRAIPLLMHNKIPDGFETDSKLDVALRPSAPNDADYDQIPIEHFGLAMLRGMGWDVSRGVGKKGKVIAPVEAQIRPKGLGLGADRTNKKTKDSKIPGEKDVSEPIILKKGSHCVVTAGANKDLYGVVEGIDEDNSRVVIKLALDGKTCNIMQCNISLVPKKEYDKFSKYLNKQTADKFKRDEEEKRMHENNRHSNSEHQNGHSDKGRSHKRQHSDEERDHSDDYQKDKHYKKKKDSDLSERSSRSSGHKKHSKHKKSKHKKSHKSETCEREENYADEKKYKYSESSASEHEDNGFDSSSQILWVQPDLRVRVVDKKFKNVYKEKVVIVDVPSPGVCVCKSGDGKVLDGISQSSLETVIPRDDDSFVLIVSGSRCGEVGQIMKRDKDKCLTIVQLLSDRNVVLKLGYDEVCEYVGNVHARDDY